MTNTPTTEPAGQATSNRPIRTTRDPNLSLWQSSALATVHSTLLATNATNTTVDTQTLRAHPLVQAVEQHIEATNEEAGLPRFMATNDLPDPVFLSSLYYELARAKVANDTQRIADLEEQARKYSTGDTAGWLTCVSNYVYYYAQLGGKRMYTSWQGKPQGLQFSVIDYTLPNDAVVAVLGDWGTGMDDSTQLLKTIMKQHKPHAIIHLGDIYYSGTPVGTDSAPNYRGECQHNFLDIFTKVFNETLGPGKRIPVFTIPGNHEYYSLGTGFYQEVLPNINAGLAGANQPASFFCLRTQDGLWQFLGMDTGYNDSNPADQFNPTGLAPALRDDELTWHQDKLNTFSGKTILLSHHQLFSANSRLNGSIRGYPPNINTFLQEAFAPYFASKIAAWLWGHEHNMVLYQNNLLGLAKGRLIGASAYEETTAEDPYKVNYPDIPYLDPTKYRLDAANGYFNHGYAVINLRRTNPSDPINIGYYQYPSWGGTNPNPPSEASLIFNETLDTLKPVTGPPISYNQSLRLFLSGYGFLGPIDQNNKFQYYPMISSNSAVIVSLVGNAGQIHDGDTVQIQTSEASVGTYNRLGAWSTPALYYYTPGYTQQNWTIKKRDSSGDKVIRIGDDVYFINQSYTNQWLCSLQESGAFYLTTRVDANAYWTIKDVPLGPVLNYGDNFYLQIQLDQLYTIGPQQLWTQYYPVLVKGTGVALQLVGGSGQLMHGSTVQIRTTETSVGNYNLLGAWTARDCYYYTSGYANQNWQIWKQDTSQDNLIRRGDIVWITNSYYAGQWLYPDYTDNDYYISTTKTTNAYYWRVI